VKIFTACRTWKLTTIWLYLSLAMIVVASLGCLGEPSPAFQQGEQLYKTYCVACHGIKGTGVLYPKSALNNDALVTGDPNKLIAVILLGREGAGIMPGWKMTLTDQDVAAVATYIRQAWSNRAGPITPAMVQEIRAKGN
jgi:mono/diheme cytochrome c family protein